MLSIDVEKRFIHQLIFCYPSTIHEIVQKAPISGASSR